MHYCTINIFGKKNSFYPFSFTLYDSEDFNTLKPLKEERDLVNQKYKLTFTNGKYIEFVPQRNIKDCEDNIIKFKTEK